MDNRFAPDWVPETFYVAGLIEVSAGLVFVPDKQQWSRSEFQNMLDKHAPKRYAVLAIYSDEPNEDDHILGTIDMEILRAMNPETPWEIHDKKYGVKA